MHKKIWGWIIILCWTNFSSSPSHSLSILWAIFNL